MPRYAAATTVAAEKTQGQVRKLIERYGGDRVSYGWLDEGDAPEIEVLLFRWRTRRYRFDIPHPPKSPTPNDPSKGPALAALTDPRDREMYAKWRVSHRTWDQHRTQEIARRWRVLLDLVLTPLFKLAEEEPERAEAMLLAHALMPGGQTVGETVVVETPPATGDVEARFRVLDDPTPIALGAGR